MAILYQISNLMSWQEYKIHRFRKTRAGLFGNRACRPINPNIKPGLVTAIIYVDTLESSSLINTISCLKAQAYKQIEICILTGQHCSAAEQIAIPLSETRYPIRVFSASSNRLPLHLQGEFITGLYQGQSLEANCIEDSVHTLMENPDYNIAYLYSTENIDDPRTWHYLIRSCIAWQMGHYPLSGSHKEFRQFWGQAGQIFRGKDITKDIIKISGKNSLAIMLEETLADHFALESDFTRDYYLAPTVYVIGSDHLDPNAGKYLHRIKEHLLKGGNQVISHKLSKEYTGFRMWNPAAFVWVTTNPQKTAPSFEALPENCTKVLVWPSSQPLPSTTLEQWDFCIVWRENNDTQPILPKPWQGWISVNNISCLLNTIDTRVHAQGLYQLGEIIGAPPQHIIELTVVISTYRRPKALEIAITSILRQTLPLDQYEIVIVNNDPSDKSPQEIIHKFHQSELINNSDHLRLYPCHTPGLSYARNTGLLNARGRIICFLDDDAYATDTWLSKILRGFNENPKAAVIGGHILLHHPDPQPKILKPGFNRFWGQFITPYDSFTPVEHWMEYPWGGNWCALRNALLEIGAFRGQYGRVGKDFSGGEELIAALLLQKLGYQIGIQPSAVVYHQPEASRFSFSYLRKTIVSQIIVNYWMRRDQYLDETISATRNVQGAGRFLKRIFQVIRLPADVRSARLIEYFLYFLAWQRLLGEQIRDYFARLRHNE